MTLTEQPLRYIDSDGHILEPPTGMLDFAPAAYQDRIWHVETDTDGTEWIVYNGARTPAGGLAGTAGFSDEDVERVRNGELTYTQHARRGGPRTSGSATSTPTGSSCRCCIRPSCSGSKA